MTFATDPLHLSETGRVSGRLKNVPWGRNAGHVIAIAESVRAASLVQLSTKNIAMELGSNIAREPRDTLNFDHALPSAAGHLPDVFDGDVMRWGAPCLDPRRWQADYSEFCGSAFNMRRSGVSLTDHRSFQAVQHDIAVLAEHSAAASRIAEIALRARRCPCRLLHVGSAKIVASDAAARVPRSLTAYTVQSAWPPNMRCSSSPGGSGLGAANMVRGKCGHNISASLLARSARAISGRRLPTNI